MRFLLATLAAASGGTAPQPEPGIDWARVVAAIRHHRVAPFFRTESSGRLPVPTQVQRQLADLVRRTACQSLANTAELVRIAKAFRTAGLPMVVLKGAALSVQLYGDPCRRASHDIDLMVHPQDAAAAEELLRRLGYEDGLWTHVKGRKHIDLHHAGLDCLVELHTSFDDCDALFPLARLRPFQTAVQITIGGEQVATLPPAMALVFAAFHGAHHFWRRLFWLADMAAAARNPAAEWADAFALARQIGVEEHLALGATLAHDLLGAPLPRPLAESRGLLSRARRNAADLRPVLTGEPVADDGNAVRRMGAFRALAWELRLFNRTASRWALLRHRAKPSDDDRMLLHLPRPLGFLYYPLRVARFLAAKERRSSPGR